MTSTRAIAFPGQGGDWRAVVARLEQHPSHALVGALAERLGTGAWSSLDGADTAIAQPAIYVAGLVGEVAERTDPVLAMGHSLGELTAAAWAGALDPEGGLDAMVVRGRLGRDLQAARPGAMVAINRWSRPEVEALAAEVCGAGPEVLEVAVVNSPTQIVLSGDLAAIERVGELANERGAVARRLPIGGAYHSSLMEPARERFRDVVRSAVVAEPRVPVLSSTLHAPLRTIDELVEGLAASLVRAVDWPATVAAAVALGASDAIEAGPGDTLARLSRFAPELAIVAP